MPTKIELRKNNNPLETWWGTYIDDRYVNMSLSSHYETAKQFFDRIVKSYKEHGSAYPEQTVLLTEIIEENQPRATT